MKDILSPQDLEKKRKESKYAPIIQLINGKLLNNEEKNEFFLTSEEMKPFSTIDINQVLSMYKDKGWHIYELCNTPQKYTAWYVTSIYYSGNVRYFGKKEYRKK
jgi:hypothetical protein